MSIISNFPCGSGSGGGPTLETVTNIKTLTSHEKVYIQWSDPDDLAVAGSVLAAWGGTLLVRKAGSAPVSRRDGVIVLDSKTRNAYKDSYFCDSGLTDGVIYYYKLFPYTTSNLCTDVDDGAFSAVPDAVAVGNVSNISLEPAGNGKMAIRWTDPDAAVVADGITIASWASTVVVVKAGGYAASPADPDAAYTYTSTTRNGHAGTPLVATGLENGTAYYVSLFPMTTDGKANADTANRKIGTANRLVIANEPAQSGTLTYNGNSQSPVWSSYDSAQLTLGGAASATNAGTYSAVFTPQDDYMWADGSIAAKTVQWTIAKKQIAKVTASATAWTYDGTAHIPEWSGYNADAVTLGGTTSAQTNAGDFSTSFTPKDNYAWSDGTGTAVTISWSVERAAVTLPAQSGSLTYNGNAQSPAWNSAYDSGRMILGGTLSATNARTYTAAFTPTANYKWPDGTTAAKNVSWSIAKAAGSLSLSTASVTLDSSNLTRAVTVTRAGDGAITATSSNTGVATASVSGNIVTISHVSQASGTATITIKVAAGTNHNAPADKTVAVTAAFIRTLNDCTWAKISEISAAGQAANYWKVGDRKAVLVKGTVGTLSINQTLYVYILGFDHNSAKEGNGIHFGTFKTALTGGTDVCLVDGNYGSNKTDGTKTFNMNHWGDYDFGGWKACDLRYDILGSTKTAPKNYGKQRVYGDVGYDAPANTATSPVANTLMAALPSDLRAVMKPITKYTDNVGGGANTASNVTASVDYLPLLAEYEIFGAKTYANQYEKNYQAQYAYYAAGNSKMKYKHSATGSAAYLWGRSVYSSSTNYFCTVSTNGAAHSDIIAYSDGLAPIFMV